MTHLLLSLSQTQHNFRPRPGMRLQTKLLAQGVIIQSPHRLLRARSESLVFPIPKAIFLAFFCDPQNPVHLAGTQEGCLVNPQDLLSPWRILNSLASISGTSLSVHRLMNCPMPIATFYICEELHAELWHNKNGPFLLAKYNIPSSNVGPRNGLQWENNLRGHQYLMTRSVNQ